MVLQVLIPKKRTEKLGRMWKFVTANERGKARDKAIGRIQVRIDFI